MNRINLKDLSRLLSLNPSTVSRALSNHPDISPETKEKVKIAAKEFNYLPNLRAKYFRQKSSGLIAVVLPEFNMFFIPELMEGINSVIDDTEYSIIIFFSNNNFNKEKEIIEHCLSWAVDGLLISLSENTTDTSHLDQIVAANIHMVLMDKVVFTDKYSTITIDDEKAAFNATNLLLENGGKNILGVFGNSDLQITKKRYLGFKRSILDNDVISNDLFLPSKDRRMIHILEKMLLKNNYDGIFIMSDEILSQIYPILIRLNLFPEKIQITVISGGILPYQIYPPISFIHHSGYEIGKKAIQTLLKLKDGDPSPTHYQLETEIIKV